LLQNGIAGIKHIGDVATLARTFDDLIVQILELGEQIIDVIDGRSDIGIGLAPNVRNRGGCGIERGR